MREYEAEAFTYRLGAYLTGGAGAVGIGTGIALAIANSDAAASLNRDVEAYNQLTNRTTAQFEQLQSRDSDIAVLDGFVIAAFFVGAGAAVVGGLLWFLGPDPSKYEGQTTLTVGEASVTIVPGGARFDF